jgi:hypothetical protein
MKFDTDLIIIGAIIAVFVLCFITSRKSMAKGKKKPGSKCKKGIECSTGKCDYDKDLKMRFCSEPSKGGVKCNRDSNCVSNACRKGKCLTKSEAKQEKQKKDREAMKRTNDAIATRNAAAKPYGGTPQRSTEQKIVGGAVTAGKAVGGFVSSIGF